MGTDLLLLVKDNVIPPVNKRMAESKAGEWIRGNDPSTVNIHRAVGNFNSVIEFSDPYCLKAFDSNVQFNQEFMLSEEQMQLIPEEIQRRVTFGHPLFRFVYSPKSLSFTDSKTVHIEYTVGCFFDYKIIPPVVPPAYVSVNGPDLYFYAVAALAQAQSPDTSSQPSEPAGSKLRSFNPRPYSAGTLQIIIDGPFDKVVNKNRVTVDVLLYGAGSKITVVPPEDDTLISKLLADSSFADFIEFLEHATGNQSVKLVPTVCSVGAANTLWVNVSEFTNYDVVVFPVSESAAPQRQALAVAINTSAGCMGFIEDVQHFIGANNYGVISDESYITHLFKFKWRIGGFKRYFSVSKPVDLTMNNKKATGTLIGHLTLTSLDYISIELNADTRMDGFRVGGMSTSKPDKIVLPDGHEILPGDSSGLDFSQVTNTPWSFATKIQLDYVPDPNPVTRQFIEQMQTDGIRHIARPFLHPDYSAIKVNYVRLEGVSKMFFALANENLFYLPPINM